MRLRFTHVEDEHDPRYLVLAEGVPVTIGSAYGCTFVVADSTVQPEHLRVTLRGNEIVIETIPPRYPSGWAPYPGGPPPPGSPRRVWIDDVEARPYAPVAVGIDATIRIGDTLIQLEHASVAPRTVFEKQPDPLSQAELDLVAKLSADPIDDTTREIYADWLEGHGFPLRAAFIRLELEGGAEIEHSEPLAKMVGACDAGWRMAVSRGEIRNCSRSCHRRWHQVEPTDEPEVRRCTECGLTVVYAASRVDVREAGARALPVVYDAELPQLRLENVYRPRADTDEDPE